MTANQFRSLALTLSGALELAHGGHPDFRVAGKVFASLGYPDDEWGMVKLTPEQQEEFLEKAPDAFEPCRGAWGKRGATSVHLVSAKMGVVREALEAAWGNLAEKGRKVAAKKASARK
jgi:hypothetical protein